MTEQDSKKVLNYIEKTWGSDFKCPMCNKSDWGLTNTIYQLTAFNKPNTPTTERQYSVFPVIPIVCNKCGYVHFVSAIACGILGD